MYIRRFPKKKEMIELEQQFPVSGAVSETLGMLGDEQHDTLFWFIGLSQPPLVDIEGDEIKRYLKIHRRLTGDLIRSFRAHGYLQKFCPLLTHHISDEVERIMWGIADKWDFENHCPLPKGVVRSYMNGKTWTFWEKSRELYEPSRKDPNRPISPGST
ncbi:hypothetical protein CPB86DRAFT_80246 [Serendipita vermifera]|nr:hypothetical protein CPB86DRAFT_80246 [Serendipita vermifera]